MENCSPSFDEILEEIKEIIKDKRKYGLSQYILAKKLGISRVHLNRLLANNGKKMKAEYFYKLIIILNVRIR